MSDLYIETRLQAIKDIANESCTDEKDADNIASFCDEIYSAIPKLDKVISQLEEQGLLLRLPVKVGSTLYQPIFSSINKYKVIGFCFDNHRNKWMCEVAYKTGSEQHTTACSFNSIGKTVFLTREEAEQKLKEIENE